MRQDQPRLLQYMLIVEDGLIVKDDVYLGDVWRIITVTSCTPPRAIDGCCGASADTRALVLRVAVSLQRQRGKKGHRKLIALSVAHFRVAVASERALRLNNTTCKVHRNAQEHMKCLLELPEN